MEPDTNTHMNLSDQALGAIMMSLQKCILEGLDITEILKGFKLRQSQDGLVVMNPPIFKLSNEDDEEFDDA